MLPRQFAVDEVMVPRVLGRGLRYVPGVDLVQCLQHQHLRHIVEVERVYFSFMNSILFYLEPDAEVGGYHVHEAET